MQVSDKLADTLAASCGSDLYMVRYIRGQYAPHYPVPSTIGTVQYHTGYAGTYVFLVCIEDSDEGYDPQYTFELEYGRWPNTTNIRR